jgi:hypothetical protein
VDEREGQSSRTLSSNPTHPVLAAPVRPPESGVAAPLVSFGFTVRATDLLNATYEVVLQVQARYFNHTDESDVAVYLMEEVISWANWSPDCPSAPIIPP